VFDRVAEERNEPRYSPRIVRAEKQSAGPVGSGARFVAEPKGMGTKGRMTVEVLEYDRPHRLHNLVRSGFMEVDGTLHFAEAEAATRLGWDWEMHLVGAMRVMTPVLALVGPRWERRNWVGLKQYVESGPDRGGDMDDVVLEIHLEEPGEHSWWKALLNTVSGTDGSAQYRFVARPPASRHEQEEHVVTGATFPMMRWQDLDDEATPNAWIETARERLEEPDGQLTSQGWPRGLETGAHWWSRAYARHT
jgi:hypothetical protein